MNNKEIFPWNPLFEVGVKKIDEQHKELVKMINEICTCVLSTDNYEETITALFLRLIEYVDLHFKAEERYYERNMLPKNLLDKHKEYHKELVIQVLEYKKKYETKIDKQAHLERILEALVMWLSEHILDDDMCLFLVIANMKSGMSPDIAEKKANETMLGYKGNISQIISSMMYVSSVTVLELKREIIYRKKLEEQLKKENTIRKEAERKFKYLALHDSLTNLPNRCLFEKLCNMALRSAKRNGYQQSILFVDIDYFKLVNDTYGHKAGDTLLVTIGERMNSCTREADIVARIGGDEFIIHLSGECNENYAGKVATKIINELSQPIDLGDGIATIGASIGITIYPNDADNVAELIKNADSAMYVAKNSGKNCYRMYNAS